MFFFVKCYYFFYIRSIAVLTSKENKLIVSLSWSVFQLIVFGKGSCNFSGGSHKVGLPG